MAGVNLPALCSVDEFVKHDYDFIVVGGGTAGLVVAARLTENANVHVGVLEAGISHIGDPMIMTPILYSQLYENETYDWCYKTVAQEHANQKIKAWPRGKGLGGSSAINFQMYVRGHVSDYDDWAKLGNQGWGFKDLFPYFKKHEHFDDPSLYSNQMNIPLENKPLDVAYHGKDGPIHTSFGSWRVPIEKDFIEAASKLHEKHGVPANPWSGDHLGTYHSLTTVDRSGAKGTRSYATTGYLLPNAQRKNLHVLTEALVSKLIVQKDGAVTGLEFLCGGAKHTVNVKKEVVLAAGSINSPQILELSGIGNPEILRKAGVEPIVENLRIGENLLDHPVNGIGYELVEGEVTYDMLQNPANVEKYMGEYMTTQSGPMANAPCCMAFASYAGLVTDAEMESTVQSIVSSPSHGLDAKSSQKIAEGLRDHKEATIQIVLIPTSVNPAAAHNQNILLAPMPEQVGKPGLFLACCVARPLSAGSVHIKSSSPHDHPLIDPNYLAHPADVEVMAKGLAFAERLAATSPFKEKIKKRISPPSDIDLTDSKAMTEYIRGHVTTEYHPIGTIAMGQACDSRLKVLGTTGLRVVDASVMPLHVSGNPISTVYAIAEKAADLIKEDWGL